jgi:diguanylate cyclase (GGDEF)-like protein/PAS domain S-box-containing protein
VLPDALVQWYLHLSAGGMAQRRDDMGYLQEESVDWGDESGLFRKIFEQSAEVKLLIDAGTGRIVGANDAAVSFYGYASEQFRDMYIWDINTQSRQTNEWNFQQVISGQQTLHVRHHRLANGEVKEVESYSVPVNVGGRIIIYDVIHDITERSKFQIEIMLFKQVIESAWNGIIITSAESADNQIIYVNPAFEALTGYTLAEVRGKNPRLLQGPQHDQTGRAEIRAAIEAKKAIRTIVRNHRKDGTAFWCEVAISPVFSSPGVVSHWVGVQNDITKRLEAERQLNQLAYYDPLTGIPNRHLLLDRLGHDLNLARRTGQAGAVVFVDLDRFKQINNTHGQDIGDEILRVVTARLKGVLRETDLIARLGSDEFVILLPAISSTMHLAVEQIDLVVRRIRRELSEPVQTGSLDHPITASIGITVFPQDNVSASDLVAQADMAMFRAKEEGRDATCYFELQMQSRLQERLALIHDLHGALTRDEFVMYLQPQWDQRGLLVGAEALVRWRSRDGGLISPARFIPVAEETGLVVPIGQFMLREACWAIRQLEAAGGDFRIAVNVSLRQFKTPDFVQKVRQTLMATEINPAHLTLEITESVLMGDPGMVAEKMTALSQLGISFSIDDFGTGYSSLGYLKNLPLGELKIDRTFIQDVTTNVNDAALVEAILAIARAHGLRVVAEGIETPEQLDFLKVRGCEYFQGYLLGRPSEAPEMLNKMMGQIKVH